MPNDAINPLPNHPVLSAKLAVRGADAAIAFYENVFSAELLMILRDDKERVIHAELQIGDCHLMLGEEIAEYNNYAPPHFGGTPVHLHLYVKNADATMEAAKAAGATVIIPVDEQFYGDRTGRFEDPFGHVWILATRVADVSAEELKQRWAAMSA